MKKRVERLRGMHDLTPEEYKRNRWVIDRTQAFLERAGYLTVDTPILEQSDLFQASFGQESWQNLYAFRLHHRDLCLRPEYTASICRLYLDSYQQHALPLRFQYAGPIFRYESPGRNRYRQHTQLGVELFGGHAPYADAEIVQLACDVLSQLSIPAYRLELGHIGVASGFINRLNLDDQAARLLLSLMEQISRSEEGERLAQARLEALYPLDVQMSETPNEVQGVPGGIDTRYITSLLNGISISFGDDETRSEIVERFLWKMGRNEQRKQILHALAFLRELHAISGSPPAVFDDLRALLSRYQLDEEPLQELTQLVSLLEQSGVPSQQIIVNLSLGRGVSYYTGLVFEIHTQGVNGFETQLCGGGRYDRLLRAVGSTRSIGACGFAFGVERLTELLPQSEASVVQGTSALVITVDAHELPYAFHVARLMREGGFVTEVDIAEHTVSAGLRLADRKHVNMAVIVGEYEREQRMVNIKDLSSGEEHKIALDEIKQLKGLGRLR